MLFRYCLTCICVIWLKVSPTESESWHVDVPQSVVGLEGSCVVIPCHYTYPGADRRASDLTGIWFTDSNDKVYHSVTSKISDAFQHRTSLWGVLSHKNCSLKINPLRHSDRGPFTFRIEIEDFNKYSYTQNKVSITIKDSPGQPTLSIPEGMKSGKKETTTCSVIHSCPSDPPNFIWSHKGTATIQSIPQTNGQWEITSSLSFTPSKTDHKKSLNCTAVFTGGKKTLSVKTLEVKYRPENVAVLSEDSVAEGNNLNMTCSSDSNPPPHTYHWFTGAGTLLAEGYNFTLKNVSRHIGTIYCTAINTEGQVDSGKTQLNVLYPPEFKVGSSCSLDSSGVTCLCIVDSHPASEIKFWGADPASELRRTHEEKHSTLTIVTLQGAIGVSDTVHCQAINSQGNYTMALQVPHNHDLHNSKLIYISILAIAILAIIIGLMVWIVKHCRGNETVETASPKVEEINVTNKSEPERKCKDMGPTYDGDQHVYGNMGLEETYEEEYPYEYASDYEATYANV